MQCQICGSTDKWENVDHLTFKKNGLSVCKSCGFVCYPAKIDEEYDVVSEQKRPPPTVSNLFTGQRKNHYHLKFLNSLFTEWKEEQLKPRVLEVGAAFGMTLNLIKNIFPTAEVHGTEVNEAMARNAFHEYGLKLTHEYDKTLKYDLIISYKVAEHIPKIADHLKELRDSLAPKGKLYIGVPTWFECACNFGAQGFDIDYYYDPKHVNNWTKKLFETLLKKTGFKVLKEDHLIYDSAYICEACEPDDSVCEFENADDIKSRMAAMKEAYLALNMEKDLPKALKIWPNYPTAWINSAEIQRKKFVENGWDWIVKEYLTPFHAACGPIAEYYLLGADLAMRMDRYEDAIKFAEKSLQVKPENVPGLTALINCMREIAIRSDTEEKKQHYFKQAREVARHLRMTSHQSFADATNQIFLYNSKIPVP